MYMQLPYKIFATCKNEQALPLLAEQGGVLAGKVEGILPQSLVLSGKVVYKSHALLSQSRTFAEILYQRDEILQKFPASKSKRNFMP